MTFANRVTEVVERRPGISDRYISEELKCTVQQVNGECRHLENLGHIKRKKVDDEPIGNYPVRRPPKLTMV
jgi:predicted transcriptional regulator